MSRNLIKYAGYLFCLSVFVFLFVASCAVPSRSVVVSSPEVSKVKRVAVLPFSSISATTSASETVTNIFVTEMYKLGKFHVEEPGNIVDFMIKEGMTTIGEIDVENLGMMSEHLGVDAVIVGAVEEYDDGLTQFPPLPVVSLSLRMVEPGSGKIIWSAKNKRNGEEYVTVFGMGRVRSITTLTQKVVNEMIGDMR